VFQNSIKISLSVLSKTFDGSIKSWKELDSKPIFQTGARVKLDTYLKEKQCKHTFQK